MIEKIMPVFVWLRDYKRSNIRGDVLAGLTVAIMLVPQGMAYAMLAGLPPVNGLYASTIPVIIYALFGSSRHLAVGPVAVVSLLIFSAGSKLVQPGSNEYIATILLLSLMVGATQLLFGILRLGFLVNFISKAVLFVRIYLYLCSRRVPQSLDDGYLMNCMNASRLGVFHHVHLHRTQQLNLFQSLKYVFHRICVDPQLVGDLERFRVAR